MIIMWIQFSLLGLYALGLYMLRKQTNESEHNIPKSGLHPNASKVMGEKVR